MKWLLRSNHLPLLATVFVLAVLFGTASTLYEGFFSGKVVVNLLGDNAVLGIAAVGMTLVILSGGIDLSVGSMLAFTTTLIATLIRNHHMAPLTAIALALVIGAVFGGVMGFLIHRYELPPFLVTLGGMFFARGIAFVVSNESLGIEHPLYQKVQDFGVPLTSNVSMPATALAFLVLLGLGILLAHWTRFGRTVYAIGGSETSARMMGLPVGFTKIAVYALNGFCSALAGVVSTFYTGSGNPAVGMGFELDVIASVVIGGTLLTGGVGTIAGTLAGVLIFGTIQSALNFDGRLNSWWLRIAIGLLLLLFILFQRFLTKTSAVNVQNDVQVTKQKTTQPV
jgi:ribose/xylose/arabinose/galactoside ABC-type transport system permease subunit